VAERHRVVYVLHADPGDVEPAEVLRRWPTAARTLGALAAAGRFDVTAVARTRFVSQSIEHEGVEWRFVQDRSRLGWRVGREARRLRPALLHANGLHTALPILALRAMCGRRPRFVVQHHGEQPGHGRSRRAQQMMARVVDGFLFTGADGQSDSWERAGIVRPGARRFEVLESSADLVPLDRTQARRETAMKGDPAIIWVGRLIDGKDPMTALDAVSKLGPDSNAHLWMLYTDAALEGQLRVRLRADPDLAERVHLVGAVPHDRMGAWFSSADMVLATSHREGSGYALIEALACGCTPVVSDIAPHRAIVGSCGTTFPVGDASACAAALGAVLPLDRNVVRADFDARLSWSAIADQLHAAYWTGEPTSRVCDPGR
jgi:glycosyltransferase involved in cell wall biosynthesis